MNYYGYTSGYGYPTGMNPCMTPYGGCCNGGWNGGGNSCNSVAIILVLFILLVVVFGAGFLNYNNN